MGNMRGHGDGPSYAWRDLLQRWSDEWLDPVLHEQERLEPFPDEVRRTRWLGSGGATGEEVNALEDRLGARLPTSYRQFLLTSNGWLNTTHDIERILPVLEVGWARDLDPELVTGWTDGYGDDGFRVDDEEYFVYGEAQDPVAIRPEYLPHTLKISHTPEATDVYLLNPCVVAPDGEWEAWYLAHWLPGAVRYRFFLGLDERRVQELPRRMVTGPSRNIRRTQRSYAAYALTGLDIPVDGLCVTASLRGGASTSALAA